MADTGTRRVSRGLSWLFSAGLFVATTGALAAAEPKEPELSPAFKQCIMGSGGVTATMQDCMAAEYRLVDRELNAAYRDALRRLPGKAARSQLQSLQRAWLKTRWDACAGEVEKSGMTGGSGGGLIEDNCRLRVLAERRQWLRGYPQLTPNGR
jgi:uncharacterized protein YecT (DUF1311 family)